MTRDGIRYEKLTEEVDVCQISTVSTPFSPSKTHMELCHDLIEIVHAEALESSPDRVELGMVQFRREPVLGLQAYTYAVFQWGER